MLPNCLKTAPSFEILKRETKKWERKTCLLRIHKTMIQQVEFI